MDAESCKTRLSLAGLKATHQRITILQTLYALPGHPSAEEVYEELRKSHPTLSLATVYRTLDNFVEADLIKRFGGERGKMIFDKNLDTHHHLIRQDNDQIEDYDDPELNRLLAEYFSRKPIPNYNVAGFQLNIRVRPV
jgi:Fur family peroxide stress response transcriptional regulator